jgi:hypothetical protein
VGVIIVTPSNIRLVFLKVAGASPENVVALITSYP